MRPRAKHPPRPSRIPAQVVERAGAPVSRGAAPPGSEAARGLVRGHDQGPWRRAAMDRTGVAQRAVAGGRWSSLVLSTRMESWPPSTMPLHCLTRSEERRVGKERMERNHRDSKKKENNNKQEKVTKNI